jgi:hypothetical protein
MAPSSRKYRLLRTKLMTKMPKAAWGRGLVGVFGGLEDSANLRFRFAAFARLLVLPVKMPYPQVSSYSDTAQGPGRAKG